jgi:hypothetical protein
MLHHSAHVYRRVRLSVLQHVNLPEVKLHRLNVGVLGEWRGEERQRGGNEDGGGGENRKVEGFGGFERVPAVEMLQTGALASARLFKKAALARVGVVGAVYGLGQGV